MTLGANNKKQVAILGGLVLVMAYVFYTNVLSGPSEPEPVRRAATTTAQPSAPATMPGAPAPQAPSVRRAGSRDSAEGFHPVYLALNPAKRKDPSTIDPTLRLDLFTKVQKVELAGGARNLFQFTAAPPPTADPKTVLAKAGPEPKIHVFVGPRQPAPPGPPKPPPPPPPITLKFYGFSTALDTGKRTAYILDGDEIYLASEGDTLKRKYKVLRIQANSVLIEDLDAKRQQQVPLTPEEGQG